MHHPYSSPSQLTELGWTEGDILVGLLKLVLKSVGFLSLISCCNLYLQNHTKMRLHFLIYYKHFCKVVNSNHYDFNDKQLRTLQHIKLELG